MVLERIERAMRKSDEGEHAHRTNDAKWWAAPRPSDESGWLGHLSVRTVIDGAVLRWVYVAFVRFMILY